MHRLLLFVATLLVSLVTVAAPPVVAAGGSTYDPSNAASPTGKTLGHELYGTIGCPGEGLLGTACAAAARRDADGDGVPERRDRCGATATGGTVNVDGCEIDPHAAQDAEAKTDAPAEIKPGTAPDTGPGAQAGDARAAPKVDTDRDGVDDGQDRCPHTPPGRAVDDHGCERDADGDGVADSQDVCPRTPAGRKVTPDGCEPDADRDGVADARDRCPARYAKTADGCPPQTAAPARRVLEGVNFDSGDATLRPDARHTLDKTAENLKQWQDVNIEVAGHTDDRGRESANRRLAQRRAEVVRQYLIERGLAAERLVAKGYGASRPVADNATRAGRQQNRRVELLPLR